MTQSNVTTKKKKTNSWAAIFGLGCIWFGTHVGGGFASGTQTVSFFAAWGWMAVFLPVLSMLLCYAIFVTVVEAGENYKLKHGMMFWIMLYREKSKYLLPIYEASGILSGAISIGTAIAGAATLLEWVFGFNYYLCALIAAIIYLLFAIYGAHIISRISLVLSVLLVVCMIPLFIMILKQNWPTLAAVVSNKTFFLEAPRTNNYIYALWMALKYGSFQAGMGVTIMTINQNAPPEERVTGRKNIRKGILIGLIINVVLLVLNSMTVLSGMPAVLTSSLPVLEMAQGVPGASAKTITVVYQIILGAAFISTGVTLSNGQIRRWTATLKTEKLSPRRKQISGRFPSADGEYAWA